MIHTDTRWIMEHGSWIICGFKKRRGRGFHPESWSRPPNSLKREADYKTCAAAAAFDLNGAVMGLNHLPGDVQTKTSSTFTFGRKEWFENFGDVVGPDTDSGIRDHDPNLPIRCCCRD